MIFIYT